MTRRILHVTPFLWSGAGSVITRLCLDQRHQHEVAVVTSGRSKGQTDWHAYVRTLDEARVVRFDVDLFDRDPAVFWRSVEALGRIVRQWRPDVLHAHAGVPACAAALVRRNVRRPLTVVAHLYSWATGRPTWMNDMDMQGFAAADRVVCSAEAYRRILLDAGISRSRIDYVPWGLPLDQLRRAAGGPPRAGADPVIGFVGRIEPRKRQLDLVQAFARYRSSAAGARLELIGPVADPVYGREIQRCIRALRIGASIDRPGLVRSVATRVSRWDLFVSLSEDEGQGLAVLEAMALGVPVLARRVAGIEDYLRHGATGIVLGAGDPRAVADSIGEAWQVRGTLRAIAGRASRMVDRRYAWETTVRRVQEVYARAAA